MKTPGILWRRHWELLKGERKRIAWGALALLSVDLLDLIPPLVLAVLIDQAAGRRGSQLGPIHLALAYIGLVALQNALRLPMRLGFMGGSLRIAARVRELYQVRLLRLPRLSLDRFARGDLVSRTTNDLEAVERGLGMGLLFLLDSAFHLIAVPPTLVAIDPRLALLAFLPFPIVGAWAYLLIKWIGNATEELFRASAEMSDGVIENARAAHTVRSFGIEQWQCSRFERCATNTMETNLKLARLEAAFGTSLQVLVTIGTLALLVLGGERVMGHRLSTGQFVAFLQYVGMMAWPLTGLSWGFVLLRKSSHSLSRIDEVLEHPPSKTSEGADSCPVLSNELEIRNLTVSLPGEKRPRIEGISFRVRPGERIAIVGSVGSGKSTLLDSISGYLDPPFGTVFLGNRDVRTIPRATLRRHFAVVPKEAFLFSETVRENIRLGRLDGIDPLPGELAEAVTVASLDPAVFSPGLEQKVGLDGKTLSGGERQRVSLARAIYRDAPILILDQATSAVDLDTEDRIWRKLGALSRGTSLLFSTHRLSRLKEANRILVLEGGKLVESGTEEELRKLGGMYAALLDSQSLEETFERA